MTVNTSEIEERTIDFLKSVDAAGGFFEHRILIVSKHINQKYIRFFGNFTENKSFLLRSFDLFLWAHFTDMSLDAFPSGEFNSWEIPKTVFCALKLFNSYHTWVCSEYGYSVEKEFNYLFNRQLEYQVLEKQWEMPSVYSTRYSKLENVFEKEIVLLFPILLLDRCLKIESESGLVLSFAKAFYTYLLISDDLNDLVWDINGKTQSHVTALFFNRYGIMPTFESDFCWLFDEVMKELELLDYKLDLFCHQLKIDRLKCLGDISYKPSYHDWLQKIREDINVR